MRSTDYLGLRMANLPDVLQQLRDVPQRLRSRALRNALAVGGRVVQKAARAATPVIDAAARPVLRGYRKPGTVRKAISVRTSKIARRRGDVGVFVNVRPAKSGARGTRNPADPYYWRWINFGWQPGRKLKKRNADAFRKRERSAGVGKVAGAKFLEQGGQALPAALRAFEAALVPQIRRLNVRGAA
jgi:hypothetical protein